MNALHICRVAVLVVVAVMTGCASSNRSARNEPPARRGMMNAPCPAEVEGTAVSWSDVQGGAALAFTTTNAERVAELRDRVMRMAEMHNAHRGMTGMKAMMPDSTASAENIEGGAQLVLRPRDVTQLEQLRQSARDMAGRMANGQCSMMPGRS